MSALDGAPSATEFQPLTPPRPAIGPGTPSAARYDWFALERANSDIAWWNPPLCLRRQSIRSRHHALLQQAKCHL